MATYDRKEIKPVPVVRMSTGVEELDWIYGYDQTNRPFNGNIWGMPLRAISLWAGESGTGKTRTVVEICNKIASKGNKVLYFQAESDVGSFCRKIKYDSFRVSDSDKLNDIVSDIYGDRPKLAVIDSVNMIKEFGSGTKKQIELIMDAFREMVIECKCHLILLGQLNQDGTIKGSTTLPHLVDVALNIEKGYPDGTFSIGTGMKHRFGRIGSAFTSSWLHTDTGVECFSHNRYVDEKWKLFGKMAQV